MSSPRIQPQIIDGQTHWPCGNCHQVLPAAAYHVRPNGRRLTQCRTCTNAYASAYQQKARRRGYVRALPPPRPAPIKRSNNDDAYHDLLLDMHALAEKSRRTFREVMADALTRYLAREGA